MKTKVSKKRKNYKIIRQHRAIYTKRMMDIYKCDYSKSAIIFNHEWVKKYEMEALVNSIKCDTIINNIINRNSISGVFSSKDTILSSVISKIETSISNGTFNNDTVSIDSLTDVEVKDTKCLPRT